MASHICDSSKKIPWDKIKQAITGRKKKSDNFVCGGCSQTFTTICCLHIHCMRHNQGGSYYFDHVTNTAFPKHDTICSSTQLDSDCCFDVVSETDKILPCKSRSIGENTMEDLSRPCLDVTSDISVKDNKCNNENNEKSFDSKQYQSIYSIDNEDVNTETDISFVQVRKITKLDDGSMLFEMHEKDAILLDRTAHIESNEVDKSDDKSMERMNELEVPDEQSSHSSHVKGTTSLDKDVDHSDNEHVNTQERLHKEIEINQDEKAVSSTLSSEDNNKNKINSDLQTCDQDMEIEDKSVQSNVSMTEKTCRDADDDFVADGEKIDKTHEGLTNQFNGSVESNISETNIQIPVLVRSTRKRKLTPKMKESVLAKSMFAIEDISEYKCDKKKRKTNVSRETRKSCKSLEADIYASEALLSLSATNDSTEKDTAKNSKFNGNIKSSKVDSNIDVSDVKCSAGNSEVKDTNCKMGRSVKDIADSPDTDGKSKVDDEVDFTIASDERGSHFERNETDNCDNENDNQGDTDDYDDDDDFVPKLARQISNGLPKHRKQESQCKTCGKIVSAAMIKHHKQMHSSEKKFTCNKCGKTLKTAACLRSHIKTHGEKEWKCDICPAAFFRKAYLETHKTNHTGIYPYVCDLCGMKFKLAYILQRHINCIHKNIRRYKCDICQQGFFRAATRDQHRIRHFDPSLKCSYCPKMFKADLDLRKHELTHTGEKLFFCPLCNHGFSQIWPYYKHMWAIHQIQKEEAKKMKINNPDMKNMKKMNKNSNFMENLSSHTNGPRTHFSSNTYMKTRLDSERSVADESRASTNCTSLLTSEIVGNSLDCEKHETETQSILYSTSHIDSCMTDTIVLDIGQSMDVNNTIVIQSEDIHTVDNSAGFIVVDDGQGDGSIVVLSEFHDSEIEHIVNECATSSL